ncbi:uncharacterized protein LOC108824838 [Raphanus sativus]|uniref:Uncharacterized protein LOC108824838 n=1 Tax=Raphanus sativus TaxID=3726 RepID=A0A6J0L2Q6_RAPSA|nr:uncharacterized protein LOC108824838 [Raphanus sativus]
MAKPGVTTCAKIRESTKFYPYFKDCIGAIDGTHIFATVPKCDVPSYRNRKGFVSQNVLATCNFDLEFMYVLSGWEGSAHDSKILSDALTRSTCRLEVPEEEEEEEEENGEIGTEDVCTLESQQREFANNWRNMIASNMWTDAVQNGSQG